MTQWNRENERKLESVEERVNLKFEPQAGPAEGEPTTTKHMFDLESTGSNKPLTIHHKLISIKLVFTKSHQAASAERFKTEGLSLY